MTRMRRVKDLDNFELLLLKLVFNLFFLFLLLKKFEFSFYVCFVLFSKCWDVSLHFMFHTSVFIAQKTFFIILNKMLLKLLHLRQLASQLANRIYSFMCFCAYGAAYLGNVTC